MTFYPSEIDWMVKTWERIEKYEGLVMLKWSSGPINLSKQDQQCVLSKLGEFC